MLWVVSPVLHVQGPEPEPVKVTKPLQLVVVPAGLMVGVAVMLSVSVAVATVGDAQLKAEVISTKITSALASEAAL